MSTKHAKISERPGRPTILVLRHLAFLAVLSPELPDPRASEVNRPYLRIEERGISELIGSVAKPKTSRLILLGHSEAKLPASPAEAHLETFPNPARRNYRIHFETDDFTSLCPVTGQADFARIDIDYLPDKLCVESKSLKFYLASYRNVRAFNEAVTNRILDDFVKACAPREAIVTAQFSARGGIALTIRTEYPDKETRAKKIGHDGR